MAMVPMIGDPTERTGVRSGASGATVAVAIATFILIELVCAAGLYFLFLWHASVTWTVVGAVVAVLFGLFIAVGIRIAQEWERICVLRLGKFQRMGGPGFFWIIPVIDTTPYLVDLRIVTYDVPEQRALSKENIPVTVDAIVYYKVADAEAAVLEVENYMAATQLGAQTILRDLVGRSLLDELLQERERLSEMMKVSLDELTDAWGVKVPNVEIKEVIVAEKLEDAIAREPAARALVWPKSFQLSTSAPSSR